MVYLVFIPLFFIVMLAYFKIANHYNIVDKPNERSSHSELTIRGGGIIYLFAALCVLVIHPEFWMLILGLFIIGIISFVDDRITLSGRVRIIFHILAATLVFQSLELFHLFSWWQIAIFYVLVIGLVNAYNFMDGINGITGMYSLVVLLSLQYVNIEIFNFVNSDLIWLPILGSCVFLFFNFRTKAKCFAGDVGSITIALWIVFLLMSLILQSGRYTYILFLSVYGVDAILTIIHRIILKQNIFDAHRLHFYQVMANENKMPHLLVAVIYFLVQLIINCIVIRSSLDFSVLFLLVNVPLIVIYIVFKNRILLRSNFV